MKKKAAVVIPIYSNKLNENEKFSLNRCLQIFKKHDIIFACPYKLDENIYLKNRKVNNINPKFEKFDDAFFKNTRGYSKLLLDKEFYKRFIKYDYILIYQLDAFVFDDELDQWCKKGFDYIGAPWFEDYAKGDESSNFLPNSGNGGFSLRRVNSFLKVLNTLEIKKVKIF